MDYFNENGQPLQQPNSAPPVPGTDGQPLETTGYTEYQEPVQPAEPAQPDYGYGMPNQAPEPQVQQTQQAYGQEYGTPVQPGAQTQQSQPNYGAYTTPNQSGTSEQYAEYSYNNNNYQANAVYEQKSTHSGTSIASMVLGILSIVLCCCGPLGLILGIVGLILAFVSKHGKPFDSLAMTGLITSCVGIIISVIIILLMFFNRSNSYYYNNYSPYDIRRFLENLD